MRKHPSSNVYHLQFFTSCSSLLDGIVCPPTVGTRECQHVGAGRNNLSISQWAGFRPETLPISRELGIQYFLFICIVFRHSIDTRGTPADDGQCSRDFRRGPFIGKSGQTRFDDSAKLLVILEASTANDSKPDRLHIRLGRHHMYSDTCVQFPLASAIYWKTPLTIKGMMMAIYSAAR